MATPEPNRLLRLDIPCPQCGYNLRGLINPRCPECGREFCRADLLSYYCEAPDLRFRQLYVRALFRPRRFWKFDGHRLAERTAAIYVLGCGLAAAAVLSTGVVVEAVIGGLNAASAIAWWACCFTGATLAIWMIFGLWATFVAVLLSGGFARGWRQCCAITAWLPLWALAGVLQDAIGRGLVPTDVYAEDALAAFWRVSAVVAIYDILVAAYFGRTSVHPFDHKGGLRKTA